MLRDLLIERQLFENIQKKASKSEEYEKEEKYQFDKTVLKRLRKKRSMKKYKKKGVTRSDLKEIIALADIINLELFQGPSNSQIAIKHPEWCDNCGNCCTKSSPIFIHKDEVNPLITLYPDLKLEICRNKIYPEHFQFKQDKPCKFYDFKEKKCKVYEFRPQVCRNYPLMLVGEEGNARDIINLRYNCNYAIRLVLEKSMILFDMAINRL
jgi:uncharacterized protein